MAINKSTVYSLQSTAKSGSRKSEVGKSLTMEELLASSQKVVNLRRGQEVEGAIVAILDSELILDLGAKSEGVIAKKEFPKPQIESFKLGDKIRAFVILSENENGQVVLSTRQSQLKGGLRGGRNISWDRFKQAQREKASLKGKVLEVNKGGIIIEVGGARGFIPNSQVGFELISKQASSLQELVGQNVTVVVSEVDEGNNKLIFTQKGQTTDEVKKALSGFKKNEKVTGKITLVLPFALIVETMGVRGMVLISEIAWERVEDLSSMFEVGQDVEAMVLGIDEDLGRLNLSLKKVSEDPFLKIAEQFPVDEVVKGEVTSVTNEGVTVGLEGAEGFLPASRMDADTKYEVGLKMSFLVDSLDTQKRRINLAPFVTSTAGLIYK